MNNQPIKLAVFDIAGTTVKDNGNVADAFIKAFDKYGFTIPADEVYTLMGYKKPEAIKMMLEKYYTAALAADKKLVGNIHTAFTDEMIRFYEDSPSIEPMPDAEFVFSQLQAMDIKVALNTGFGSMITEVILKRLGWNRTSLVDFVISSDEVSQGRPSPLMIQAAMQATGVESKTAVIKIGDTEVDILEGRNAGCALVIAVTTGAYSREQLMEYTPDVVIDSLQQLLPILKSAALAN